MKTWKQLLRQPGKTLAGIMIVALAVAVLVICIGQMIAARQTETTLHESFTTIALQTPYFQYMENGWTELVNPPAELGNWILEAAEENPEIVRGISQSGQASAWLEGWTPDMYTNHRKHSHGRYAEELQPTPQGAPYSCAMFEVTVTEVGEVQEHHPLTVVDNGLLYGDDLLYYSVRLDATIDRVIGLAQGLPNPEGFHIWLNLQVPDSESLEAMQLEVGGRYLVYGRDYDDLDWFLRSFLDPYGSVGAQESPLIAPFEDEKFYALEGKSQYGYMGWVDENGEYHDYRFPMYYWDDSGVYYIREDWVEYIHRSQMTLVDTVRIPDYEWTLNPDGTKSPGTLIPPDPEDVAKYSIPTIARLEGSAEEFLASPEGARWTQVLSWIDINASTFPILGVDKLGYIVDFARENARIVEGRDFTLEELENGEKVCILSQTLAQLNGISVGDTIYPQFYDYDFDSPFQYFTSEGHGTVNPGAYFFTDTTPFHGEPEAYTVVGLYRQLNEWGCTADNDYPFTPNTIFVPKSSVTSSMDYGTNGIFQTLVLENGCIPEWTKLASEAGYDQFFTYYDQGYSAVGDSFYDYQKIVERAMWVGLAMAGILYLLFLLLFPGRLGAVLNTMGSMGARKGEKLRHILLSSLGILVPGTLFGTALGLGLWQNVTQRLLSAADSTLNVNLEGYILLCIGAGQLLIAFLAIFTLALYMTRTKNFMKRR